jgi:dihydrofolate reductase
LVPGSPTLVRSLIQAGLLGQLHVIVCSVVVGAGARLFDDIIPKTAFKIAAAMTISTGVPYSSHTSRSTTDVDQRRTAEPRTVSYS